MPRTSLLTSRGAHPERLFPTPHIAVLRWRALGIAVVTGYAPALTAGSKEDERNLFWLNLQNTLSQTKAEFRRTILCGDFNAHLDIPGQPMVVEQDPNAVHLGEALRFEAMGICNWKGPTRVPDCHTFKGNDTIPSSTVDYIAVPADMLQYVGSFTLLSRQAHYPKHSQHKMLLAQMRFPGKMRRTANPTPRVTGNPPFSEKKIASEVDIAYGQLLRAFSEVEKEEKELHIPSFDEDYMSTHSAGLAALLHEAKDAAHSDPETVTSSYIAGLEERYRASRSKDRDDALDAYVDEIEIFFTCNTEQRVVYKALQKYMRKTGRIGSHTSRHAKLALLEHYRDLLGSPTPNPAIALDPCEYPLRPTARMVITVAPPSQVFTDGSFLEDLGLCGWAVVDVKSQTNRCGNIPRPEIGRYRTFKITPKEFHCGFAETYAILEALRAFPDLHLQIFTDCEACVITHRSLEPLESADFRNVAYGHLWKEIHALSRWRKVEVLKVTAHKGVEHNEEADVLAKFGAFLPGGAARVLQCPKTAWWKDLLRRTAHLGPDDSRRGRIYAANSVLMGLQYFPSFTLIPPRFTPPLLPLEPRDEVPEKAEIVAAIESLSNVSCGNDEIPAELCKHPAFVNAIVELIQLVWRTGDVPVDWQRTIMVSLRKNPRKALDPGNCRGISLTSIPSRILTHIIQCRSSAADILPQQIGFRRAHSCSQAHLIVRHMISSTNATGQPLVLAFIDLKRAFDSIDRSKLRQVLGLYGFGDTTKTLIERLWEDEVVLRYPDRSYSEPFHTKVGVKQGCVFSPFAFNAYINIGLSRALPRLHGITAFDTQGTSSILKALAYADDLVLFATSAEAMSQNLEALADAMAPLGLRINHTKTHVLYNSCYGYCPKDTTTGYFGRRHKQRRTKEQRPHYSRTSLSLTLDGPAPHRTPAPSFGYIHVQPRAPCLGCPYITCPYVTQDDAVHAPHNLRDHMKNRHGLTVQLTPLQEPLAHELSEDPVTRPTVPMSKAPRGLEGSCARPPVVVQGVHIVPVLHFEYL